MSIPTAALLTPRGRGAVATIQFRGDAALLDNLPPLFVAANGKPLADQPVDRVAFGRWSSGVADASAEEVVVCRTACDTIEVHCHGGDAAASRILADLERRGCEILPAIEFVARQTSMLDAECLDALSRAPTLRTAAILLDQQSGTSRKAFQALRSMLTEAVALDTRLSTLDYPELHELLRWSNFGRHLTQPWRVVVGGRPNVGKSSLINALVGYERSIVFDQPGTTRDVVTAETALDGWPIQFADTAGLRDTNAGEIESAGIELARRQLDSADLVLLVFDISQPWTAADDRLLAEWPDAFAVANKSDLSHTWQGGTSTELLAVSARTGTGIDTLCDAITARLVPELPVAVTAVPITARQIQLLCQLDVAIVNDDRTLAIHTCNELLT